VNIPVFLAGGLNCDPVASSVETVAPFRLNVCNGVRPNG